jgi:purine-binding chemotaxis protein CheW
MDELLIVVEVRGHHVAIEGEHVIEIVALPLLKKAPSGHPAFMGLLSFRGETVPVYNLGKIVWNDPVPVSKAANLLVLRVQGRPIGLAVDRVLAAESAADGVIESADGLYSLLPGISKMFKRGHDVTPVLDPGALINSNALSFDVEALSDLSYASLADASEEKDYEILRERAERLAVRHQEKGGEEAVIGILVVRFGGEYFGFRIENVSEIIKPQSLTPVPGAPREIDGIIALRGEIVPVLNGGSYVLGKPTGGSESERIVLMSTIEGFVGVRVDEVIGLTFVSEKSIEIPIASDERLNAILAGEVFLDGRLVTILEPGFQLYGSTLEVQS